MHSRRIYVPPFDPIPRGATKTVRAANFPANMADRGEQRAKSQAKEERALLATGRRKAELQPDFPSSVDAAIRRDHPPEFL